MKKFKDFTELADDTMIKIKSFGVTASSVFSYYSSCTNSLNTIMSDDGVIFNKELAFKWLEYTIPINERVLHTKYSSFRRTILLLNDNYNGILDKWKTYPSVHAKYPRNITFLHILEEYARYLVECDYAQATIEFKIRCAKCFFLYLETVCFFDIKECSHQILSQYLVTEHFKNRKPGGVSAEFCRLKHFIIYLEEYYYVKSSSLHFAIPTYRISEEHIITILSNEIEAALLDDFKQYPANLRDRCVYLMALHCGLRTVDIINLKFTDIEWDKKILHIIQKKTNISLDFPLDSETLNALIDYILKERRECECDYIFITAVGPIRPLLGRPFSIHSRIKAHKIDVTAIEDGLHIMRRTFASKLLREGVELSIISSALGQTDKKQVNKYLSTDENKMKLCALDISNFLYEGGLF